MPRAGLDADAVVRTAAALADAEGLERLTLARVADTLGVRAPSLYAHVDGIDDLRARIGAHAARELTDLVSEAAAGRAGRDALRALADAYRAFAHAHPGAYAALQRAPAELTPAAERLLATIVAVLRGYDLQGEDAIHGVRLVRSALHGFVALEAEGGFRMPVSLQETYERLITLLDHGLSAASIDPG